ncbi:MAG: ABC transporter permease [Gemmata sp.]|jgi:ABC-type polysaccharide/polyol phosphate export permease
MLRHLTAVWAARHFLLALVKLDLRLRYRRSVLGVGWSLLNPIAMTAVFTVVFSNLFGNDDPIGYAAYALAGLAVWGFLRDAATLGSKAFLTNEVYIRQSPMPYTVYTLRTVLGQAIHACLAVLVVVTVQAFLKGDVGALAGLVLALPGLLLALIAAWAVATIGAFVTAFFHDMSHILEVAAQLGFFLTPIMYRRSLFDSRGLGWVVDINPANLYISLIRDPILAGAPTTEGLAHLGQLYLPAGALTAVLVALAVGTVGWLQKKVIFHL